MMRKRKGEPKRGGGGILTPDKLRAIEQRRNKKVRMQELKIAAERRQVRAENDANKRAALIARAEKKRLIARYARRYDLTEDEVRKQLDAALRSAQRAGTRGVDLPLILSAWEASLRKH